MNLFKKNNKQDKAGSVAETTPAEQTPGPVTEPTTETEPGAQAGTQVGTQVENEISYQEIVSPPAPPNADAPVELPVENATLVPHEEIRYEDDHEEVPDLETVSEVVPEIIPEQAAETPAEIGSETEEMSPQDIMSEVSIPEDIMPVETTPEQIVTEAPEVIEQSVAPDNPKAPVNSLIEEIENIDNDSVMPPPVERLLSDDEDDYNKPEVSLASLAKDEQAFKPVSVSENSNDDEVKVGETIDSAPGFVSMEKFTEVITQNANNLRQYQEENASLLVNLGKMSETNGALNDQLAVLRRENSSLTEELAGVQIDVKELEDELHQQDFKESNFNSKIEELTSKNQELAAKINELESKHQELIVKNHELEESDKNVEATRTLQRLITTIEKEGDEQRAEIVQEAQAIIRNAQLKAEEIELRTRIEAEEQRDKSMQTAAASQEAANLLTHQANVNLAHTTNSMEEVARELIEQGRNLLASAKKQADATIEESLQKKARLEMDIRELEKRKNQLNGYTHHLLERLQKLQKKVDNEIDSQLIPALQLEAPIEKIPEKIAEEVVLEIPEPEPEPEPEPVSEPEPEPEVFPEPEPVEEIIIKETPEEPIEEVTPDEPEYEAVIEVEETPEEIVEELAEDKEEVITYNELMRQREEENKRAEAERHGHYEDPGE